MIYRQCCVCGGAATVVDEPRLGGRDLSYCDRHAGEFRCAEGSQRIRLVDQRIASRGGYSPLPVEVLACALQDRIHATSGQFRGATAIKVKR